MDVKGRVYGLISATVPASSWETTNISVRKVSLRDSTRSRELLTWSKTARHCTATSCQNNMIMMMMMMISRGRVWKSRTVRHRQIKVSVVLSGTTNKHSTYRNSAPWSLDLGTTRIGLLHVALNSLTRSSGAYFQVLWRRTRVDLDMVMMRKILASTKGRTQSFQPCSKSPFSTIYSSTETRKYLCSLPGRWPYIRARNKSYPCNRPWRPIGLWDVEVPTFSR
jgi:hypothetical protein